MLRTCCRSSGLILVALLCAAGAAPAQSPVQDQVPPAELVPDDAAAQAHALRQIIAAMEVEAAELEPRLRNARQHFEDLNRQVEETAARLEEDRADLAKLREDERQARSAVDEAAAEKGRQQAALAAASSSDGGRQSAMGRPRLPCCRLASPAGRQDMAHPAGWRLIAPSPPRQNLPNLGEAVAASRRSSPDRAGSSSSRHGPGP